MITLHTVHLNLEWRLTFLKIEQNNFGALCNQITHDFSWNWNRSKKKKNKYSDLSDSWAWRGDIPLAYPLFFLPELVPSKHFLQDLRQPSSEEILLGDP